MTGAGAGARVRRALVGSWAWIAIVAGAAGLAGYVVSASQSPGYQSTALVQIVSSRQAEGESVPSDELVHLTNAYVEVARNLDDGRLAAAARAVGPDANAKNLRSRVRISPRAELEFVRFVGSGPSATAAATAANAYAQAFAAEVAEIQDSQRRRALELIDLRVQRVLRDLADRRLALADPDALVLKAELEALQTEAAQQGARVGDSVRTVRRAAAAGGPSTPTPLRDSVLAFVTVGLVAGGFVYLRTVVMDRFESAAAVEAELGLPLLGEIPDSPPDDRRMQEAVRALRLAVEFSMAGPPGKLGGILVTSAEPRSGKSHTTEHLARSWATEGRRVVAVDGDLYRPTLHERFGLRRVPGLSNLLRSAAGERLAVEQPLPVTGARDGVLHVVTAGSRVENLDAVLSGPRLQAAIARLRHQHDVLVFDSPPILASAAALVLVAQVRGVILVVDGAVSRRQSVRRAVQALRSVDAPLLGFVYNRSAAATGSAYGYYGTDEAAGEPVEDLAPHGPPPRG